VFSDEENGRRRPVRHLGIAVDITESKQAEETRTLLVRELSHRVKNTLATVQAIAGQTSRRVASKEEFVRTFTDRLQSLARAHTLLTQSNWQGADIGDIVREQLTFAGADSRIVLNGPPILLSAQYSLQMALVLHELGTNARKYGALSVPKGTLEVTWRLSSEAGRRLLILDWRESGGPRVKAPKSKGFGTMLLERSFSAGGEANITFKKDGVVCQIRLPLEPAAEAEPQAA
jgi:two-component sensor histidine kinase